MIEWTLEASGTARRIARPGYHDGFAPINRVDNYPHVTARDYGSRIALYIK